MGKNEKKWTKGISSKFADSPPPLPPQLEGGKHVLITREDRRSQLKTFKEAIGYLNSGIPIMAFPEGGRTEDGRLGEFKNGVFR